MTNTTTQGLRERFLAGTYTPEDALRDAKEVIAARDGEINAYIDVFEDATEDAARATRLLEEQGENASPLCGVPISIKNNIVIEGKRATAGSKILEEYIAPYSATVVTKLREAGAVIVGSTNLDEFGMGSSTEHSAFGATKNPLDTSRVPGGSSGGSAASVAMGSVPVSLGTDTGGSVRLPASFCGLVGLKPTYGAVSRNGLIAMGSSLEGAGVLAHSVTDAKHVFHTIAGKDAYDATSYEAGTYPEVPVKETYRIGVPRALLREGVDADVLAQFETALTQLAQMGHEVVDVELPHMERGLAAYYIVMPAEVSSNMARYDGVRYGLHVEGEDLLEDYIKTRSAGFGEEVKRRILLGTYVLSSGYYDAYYSKAELVRKKMREELRDTFAHVDVLVTPTAPTPAFKIGEKQDPLAMYASDIFTVPANLTGVPALSVPGGTVERDGKALPVGVQFITSSAGEARLFDIGARFLGE